LGQGPEGRRERRWARLRRRFKVSVGRTVSFTIDVGAGGFCAQLLRVMPPGSAVEGTIVVDGQPLPYAGRVVWATAGEPHMGLHGRMGVSFTSVEADLPAILAKGGAQGEAQGGARS
jgi:hypothetical protein